MLLLVPIPRYPPPPPSYTPPSEPIKNTLEYRMLYVGVNLIQKKLDKYYIKTDQLPVYIATVVLHPRLKQKQLKKAQKHRQGQINKARTSIRNLQLKYANIKVTDDDVELVRVKDSARQMDEDLLSNFSNLEDDIINDKYSRQCDEGRQLNEFRPLKFQSKKRQRQCYPYLARIARDLFIIPAMSNELERMFSSAGLIVTPLRGRLLARSIREAQCIKSQIKTGIITSLEGTFKNVASLPINIEEN